jgi:hypothetical protein
MSNVRKYIILAVILIIVIVVFQVITGGKKSSWEEREELSQIKDAPAQTAEKPTPPGEVPPKYPSSLSICSFNIQFLGHSKSRDDAAVAQVLEDCDIAVVQELVAPPYAGTFPDGDPFKPDGDAVEFFDVMKGLGFDYVLSEEDTGTNDKIHQNSSATEWWVTFFRRDRAQVAADLPSGFLAVDRSNHGDYERVPYAFAFRTLDHKADFVLISVHLKPGGTKKDKARRQHELSAIARWIDAHDEEERDFVILGDMNIEDDKELAGTTPRGFISLNDECRPTNTNLRSPKPYDHVMFNPRYTTEIDRSFDMVVIDLIAAMAPFWAGNEPYPGHPYDHDEFRKHYSDHHPVMFEIDIPGEDDDGPVRTSTR